MRPLFLYAGVCAVSVLSGWLMYARMVRGPADRLAAAQSSLRSVGQGERARELHEQLARARDSINSARNSAPTNLSVSSLLDALTNDLDTLAVGERKWSIGPATTSGGFQDLSVTVAFASSYKTVGDLLQRIGEYPGRVRMSHLTIRKGPRPAGDTLSVTMDLVTCVELATVGPDRSEAAP